MLKLKDFKKYTHLNPELIDAVVDQLGGWQDEYAIQHLADIAKNSIDGGYGGFIYYADTVKFYIDNQFEIVGQAHEDAQCIGADSTINFVRNFNCLGEDYRIDHIGMVLYSNVDPFTLEDEQKIDAIRIANALAWYAGEEVARSFADFVDEQEAEK